MTTTIDDLVGAWKFVSAEEVLRDSSAGDAAADDDDA